MKNSNFQLAAIIITSVFLASCYYFLTKEYTITGKGYIIEKTLAIDGFNGINLNGDFEIFINQGEYFNVVAKGNENILNRIETTVENNTWNVKLQEGRYKKTYLAIYITVPNIKYLAISGSGIINVDDFKYQPVLECNITGNGQLYLNSFTTTTQLKVLISGNGNVIALKDFPDIQQSEIILSGRGTFHGYPVNTPNCIIKNSGVGNSYVSVKNNLDVNITGIGNVHYKGNPKFILNISGLGTIINQDI